jgi:hypothetical protein
LVSSRAPTATKNGLIAAADAAQREGKNRTARGGVAIADILRDPVPAAEPEA